MAAAPRKLDILEYLFSRSIEGTEPVSREEIALNSYPDVHPTHDPISLLGNVSTEITRLNKVFLPEYFNGDGFSEARRVEISKREIRLKFPKNDPVPGDLVAKFWGHYLETPNQSIVYFTEPLLFQDDKRFTYVRNRFVNDVKKTSRLTALLGKTGFNHFTPTYHYLAAGEINAMLSIVREFQRHKVPLEFANLRRITQLGDIRGINAILLGSARTSALLAELQKSQEFHLTDRGVVGPNGGSRMIDGPSQSPEDKLLGDIQRFAVLTRCPNIDTGCQVTIIAANNGRAAQGVAEFLCSPQELEKMYKTLGYNLDPAHSGLP